MTRALALLCVLLFASCGSAGSGCPVVPPTPGELTAYFAPFAAQSMNFTFSGPDYPAKLVAHDVFERQMWTYQRFHGNEDADIKQGNLSLVLVSAPSVPHTYDAEAQQAADCIGYKLAFQQYNDSQQVTTYYLGRPNGISHTKDQVNWLAIWALETYPTAFIGGWQWWYEAPHFEGGGDAI